MPRKEPDIGDLVVFHDSIARAHNALVICVFGVKSGHPDVSEGAPSLNLVIVNSDEAMEDSYGRQTMRETSVPHKSHQQAHGFYWCYVDEEPTEAPLQFKRGPGPAESKE